MSKWQYWHMTSALILNQGISSTYRNIVTITTNFLYCILRILLMDGFYSFMRLCNPLMVWLLYNYIKKRFNLWHTQYACVDYSSFRDQLITNLKAILYKQYLYQQTNKQTTVEAEFNSPPPPTIHRGLEWPQFLNCSLIVLWLFSVCLSANFLIFLLLILLFYSTVSSVIYL